MNSTYSMSLSDRADVEWHPDAEPPVYLIRHDDEQGGENEVYLTPEEARVLSVHIDKKETAKIVAGEDEGSDGVEGAFEDFEPVDAGPTNALENHDATQ